MNPYIFTENYNYYLHVHFRNCTIGETPQNYSQATICSRCGQGFYSLQYPENNLDAVQCEQCKKSKDGVEDCPGGPLIHTSVGFWRFNLLSADIEQCDRTFEQFCVGGLSA